MLLYFRFSAGRASFAPRSLVKPPNLISDDSRGPGANDNFALCGIMHRPPASRGIEPERPEKFEIGIWSTADTDEPIARRNVQKGFRLVPVRYAGPMLYKTRPRGCLRIGAHSQVSTSAADSNTLPSCGYYSTLLCISGCGAIFTWTGADLARRSVQ